MTYATRRSTLLCLVAAASVTACAAEPVAESVSAEIGDPLPGLSTRELAQFEAGRAHFSRQFTPESGLGPRFNENACSACHTTPADGGTGETLVTKATRLDGDDRCDLLIPLGGENVRLRVTPAAAAAGATRPPVPGEATHTARFTIPFLFGLGLVDAIAQSTLDAMADPDDADADGISGRVGRDASGTPARFGRKADQATLASFAEGAFRLEMGITTPAHPDEAMAGALPPVPPGADPAEEPEVDGATLESILDFLRFLAPPRPAQPSDEADRTTIESGRTLFTSLGCIGCHTPSLNTGTSPTSAIAGKSVGLYSDLLLHDMGPALEGTCASGAATREYRTEPLLGLRYRRLFLHDGRAGRVIDAVLAHGGEAQASRDAFAAMDRLTQEHVLRFLGTL
jgi:CxxC motif-containing protein (DUF1111 family)